MNKIIKYLKENFTVIVLILILLSSFRECRNSSEIKKIKHEITVLNDSLYQKKSFDSKLELIKLNTIIEGLKTEKRMIQSTDRKMMDVNRQSEIDKELIILEKKLYEYETLDK
jgi:hypothetical protein